MIRPAPRPVVDADLPALVGLHAGAFPPDEAWGAGAITTMLAMPGAFGLMVAGGGFILVRAAGGEAEVLTLAVASGTRRQGVGTALVIGAMAGSLARGAGVLFLEVSEQNTAARGLYAALGLTEVGRRLRYYADGTDALVLSRVLCAAAGG